MTATRRSAQRGAAFLAVLALLAHAANGQAQDPQREKQIADLQKQIDELNRKLGELKSAPATTAATPAGVILAPEFLKALAWRPLGPAAMGGRIVALAVDENDPNRFFAATASGGLLKTVNGGMTFEHQFDRESAVSIGDVAIAPSNRDIVWVGTGENNPRNSVSYGDGVYKSTDGGKTWANMGLKTTYQIGKILIHPKNPDVVYVGALGRLWGPSDARGLFKTTDGGKTWEKILYVDDKTGVIDARMKPDDPETLIVATYERERDLYDVNDPSKKFGPGAGIHKTTDGGKTFTRLSKGLPTAKLGRVGLDWYRKDPNVVFAIIESETIGSGPPGAKPPGQGGAYLGIVGEGPEAPDARIGQVTPNSPAQKAGLQPGDLVLAVGGQEVKAYTDLTGILREKNVGDKLKFKIRRGDAESEVEVTLEARPASGGGGGGGGGSGLGGLDIDPNKPFGGLLGGQIENAQDRQGPGGFEYGGVYKSTDAGESWTRINSLNPRPMYFSQVRVDPSDDQRLYVLGIALYRSSDGGKTFRGDAGRGVHADHHALWIDPKDGRSMVLGGDGGVYVTRDRTANWDHLNHVAIGQFYHVALDPRVPFKAYGGLQDNGSWGGPGMVRSGQGAVNEDWLNVFGGDGFKCQVDPDDPDQIYYTAQNGSMGRRHFKTGEQSSIRPRPEQGKRYRFNWNTPFVLSKHNTRIFYAAGNYVFRSLNRGDDLRIVSPEITRTEKGTATALAESPRNPDVVYAGTDDGNLWITRDGGKSWDEISKAVGLPKPCYVATIEPSRFEEGRVYACFDGHRSDVDDPLIYVSENFGKTWTTLRADLPVGSSRCLREDIENPNLLWLGTEFGLWASLDRGKAWNHLKANLPTVAIHEVAQHPTSGEIVLATHGRSLWAGDVTALRQSTPDVLKAGAWLFKPPTAYRWRPEPSRGGTNRRFVAQNPPSGAQIGYVLPKKAESVTLKVLDYDGTTIRDLRVSTEPGLHRVSWDLTRPAPPRTENQAPPATGIGGMLSNIGRRLGSNRPRPVPPGVYRAVLTVDGKEFSQPIRVEADPAYPTPSPIAEELESEDEGLEMVEEERLERGEPIDDRIDDRR